MLKKHTAASKAAKATSLFQKAHDALGESIALHDADIADRLEDIDAHERLITDHKTAIAEANAHREKVVKARAKLAEFVV